MSPRRAEDFDKYYWLSDPLLAGWLAAHLSSYGASICDVGAGKGGMVAALSACFDRLVFVEPSPEMMRGLLKGIEPFQHKAHVFEACGESIPLSDKSVDVALAKSSLHHFTNREQCIREMARIASAAVAIVEVVSPDPVCINYARRLVLSKEPDRDPNAIFSEQNLIDMLSPASNECRVLHFDQYIDLNIWLDYSDLPRNAIDELLEFARSQAGAVRSAMHIHSRSGHLMQLRRMAMVIGVLS